jgi:hypothetical protein
MTKGLDEFPTSIRTTTELVMRARQLVSDALGACNQLNAALTDEQRYQCERVIGAAYDSLSSVSANLDYVEGKIRAGEPRGFDHLKPLWPSGKR